MSTYKIKVSVNFLGQLKEFASLVIADTQAEAEDTAREGYAMEMGTTIDEVNILSSEVEEVNAENTINNLK